MAELLFLALLVSALLLSDCFEADEDFELAEGYELDDDSELLDDSELAEGSDAAGFLPEFLKSVSYQPVPFNLNAAAVTCLRSEALPQAGQSVNFGSLIFCSASRLCSQSAH